jgi:hypothetical protein
MAAHRRCGLDFAVSALTQHVRAIHARQEKTTSGELSQADMTSLVRTGELLLAIECSRANFIFKTIGRRLATYPTEDLQRLFESITCGDIEPEDGNAS